MVELNRLLVVDELTGDLMEDVRRILESTPPLYIDTALTLLYNDKISIPDGLNLVLYLVRGLRVNEFFKFHVLTKFLRQ